MQGPAPTPIPGGKRGKKNDILFNQKSPEKFVKKSEKKVLTKWFSGGIIVKLSGARATQTAAENRITTAFEGISRDSAPEKTSKKSQKSS